MKGSGKAAPLYAGALLGGSILGIQRDKGRGSVDEYVMSTGNSEK
jgi:hypothetical protein